MPAIVLIMDGDNAWPDLKGKSIIHHGNEAPPIPVAVFDKGMESGLPSLMMRFDLPDGKTLIVETSAKLFCSAARALMGKYPNLLD